MPKYIDRDEILKRNMYGNANPITYRTYAEDLIKSMPVFEISGTRIYHQKSYSDSKATKSQNPRPCYVKGYDNKAIFHNWVKCQNVLLNSSVNRGIDIIQDDCKLLKEYGYIQGRNEPVIIEEIYALIEYEDGQVELVYPAEVRFADGLINEYITDFQFHKHCRLRADESRSHTIKVDLNDPRLTERLEELSKLKESGCSDTEIQRFYDKQIETDATTIMRVNVEPKEMVGDTE